MPGAGARAGRQHQRINSRSRLHRISNRGDALTVRRPPDASLEMDAYAHHERHGQTRAVVVDCVEAGAGELVDVGKPADMTEPQLRVDVKVARNRKQHPATQAPGDAAVPS